MTPVPLITAERESGPLHAPRAGLDLLRLVTGPINAVAICGNARGGKSFLMNQLLGQDDVFPTSSAVAVCTRGANISPFVQSLSDFRSGSERQTSRGSGREPAIALIDTEGQGDMTRDHDVRLAAAIFVISRVCGRTAVPVFRHCTTTALHLRCFTLQHNRNRTEPSKTHNFPPTPRQRACSSRNRPLFVP